MKRLILAIVLLWGAAGCEVHDGGGTFQPTRPGYYLFQKSYEPLCNLADNLRDIFAFARYYATPTDEERETLHDAFFYANRITHSGDTWRIISSWEEVEIVTGGLPLQAEGSSWTINYTSGYYDKQHSTLTIGRDASAEGRYTLLLSENFDTLTGRFTVETAFVTQVLEPGIRTYTVKQTIEGEGRAAAHDVDIDFTIRTPLRNNSSSPHAFVAGALQLTSDQGDEVEVTLDGNDFVKIGYNGHNATWSRRNYYWVVME